MEVYYWKSIDWLVFFQYNNFTDRIFFPKSVFDRDWVTLPIGFGDDVDVFAELNQENNPLSPPYYQDWLKKHGVSHTSMSVGDIIRKGQKFFVCLPIGWMEMVMG